MKRMMLALMVVVTAFSLNTKDALALNEIKTEFKKKYLDSHKDEAFKKLAKKSSCKVCHVDKKPKKIENLNEYGKQLSKLIDGNANTKKKEARKKGPDVLKKWKEDLIKEVHKAFDEVAKKKSEAGDTFGDRIKNGLLPSSTDTPKEDKKEKEKKK